MTYKIVVSTFFARTVLQVTQCHKDCSLESAISVARMVASEYHNAHGYPTRFITVQQGHKILWNNLADRAARLGIN